MTQKDKVIFLSGAKGFIGRHFIARFHSYFKNIIPISNDIRTLTPSDLAQHMRSGCDYYFIHLAGISSVSECEKNRDLAMDVNCNGTLTAYLAFSKCYPEGIFINMSTAHVYKATTEEFVRIDEDFPIEPQSYYGETKLQAEVQLKTHQQDARILNLRLFNHTHKNQSPHFFLPSVYSQILSAKQASTSCTLEVGDLTLKRDISHIDDLLEALRLLINKEDHQEKFQTFNVCSGAGKSLQTLVRHLSEIMQVQVATEVIPTKIRAYEPRVIVGSNNRLKANIPWDPVNSLDEYILIRTFLT